MSLKKQAVSGVKWSGTSMAIVTVLQFITLAVLARLLPPVDFGLMGMIMVVIGFAQAFTDMGISNAIIYRQDATREQLSSIYWLNIFAGIIVFCIVCLSTPLVVCFYREPRLSNLLYLTALIFLITPLGQQFQVLLQKNLKFNKLAKIEITAAGVNTVVAIGMAIKGFGVYSLILGQLFAAISKVVFLCWVGCRRWRPSLHFARHDLKGYLSFGLYQMGERAINYFNANIDNIIIGRFLGPAALGFYTLAYQISIFPLTKLNPVITKVMFPLFSKIQNDSIGFRDGYSKMVKYVALFSFPLMVGMFVVANEFILLFLGKKWVASILVLQILCIISLFKSLVNPIGTVLLAKGRADIGFYWNIIGTISVGAAVIIGVNWGITGVAIAILILQVPSFFIIQPIVNGLIKMRMGKYLQILVTPLVCSFAMLVCVFILKKIMGNIELPYQFVISVVVGIIVYVLTYYLRDKETVVEAVTLIKGN